MVVEGGVGGVTDGSRDLGSCGTSIKTNRGRHANTQRQRAENMHRRTHSKVQNHRRHAIQLAEGAGHGGGAGGVCTALT